MEPSSKTLFVGLKRYRLAAVLLVLAISVIGLSRYDAARRWLSPLYDSSPRLSAQIAGEVVQLRWNALVNPWRHPQRELTYQTELKLPLLLRNTGGRVAEIQAVRLLSSWQDGHVMWEGVWQAQERTWDRITPIETQIQQHRKPLDIIPVAIHAPPLAVNIDLVPVDHPQPLGQAGYRNLLQVKLAGGSGWLDLLQFGFSVPEDFKLQDSRGYRYQFWQSFPLDPAP